jgi:hypothetical protein
MISIGGTQYQTVIDAAATWRVSTKTVREWIAQGIIPKPPTVMQGRRRWDTFPQDYMKRANEARGKKAPEARGRKKPSPSKAVSASLQK